MQNEGWAFRWRAVIAGVLLVPAAFLMLLTADAAPQPAWMLAVRTVLAWICFVVGATLRWWATLYVGGRKAVTLVTDGPYSVCRNPIYLGSLFLGLSVSLFLGSLVVAVGIGLLMLVYARGVVPGEERFLRTTHASVYEEYCRRVPRFWPRPRLFRTPDTIEVKVLGLRLEGARTAVWIWLPLSGELETFLRAQASWAQVAFLP
jgi:protein-S-isoprenylcysteine O-methyltransferase Ste14